VRLGGGVKAMIGITSLGGRRRSCQRNLRLKRKGLRSIRMPPSLPSTPLFPRRPGEVRERKVAEPITLEVFSDYV